jgi:hypothetical protein
MVTSSIRCPACGAADPSNADSKGVHACVYCGSRYRMGLAGQAKVLERAPAQTAKVGLVVGIMLAVLMAAGIGFFVALRPSPDSVSFDPQLDIDIPTPAPLEAPPSNPTVALTPAATPEPEPEVEATAEFVEHHRKDSGGALWVYGIVTNTSPFLVDKVEVIGVLLDAEGKELGTEHGYANRDVLAPGATSPIVILLKDTPEFASISWEIDVDKASYVPKTVSGLRVEASAPAANSWGAWESEGKVHNDGEQPAEFVKVEMQGWSADDKLIGIGAAYAKGDVLKPGESARFKHVGVQFDVKPARFEMYVEGRLAD